MAYRRTFRPDYYFLTTETMHPKPGKAPSRAQSLAISLGDFAGDDEALDVASALGTQSHLHKHGTLCPAAGAHYRRSNGDLPPPAGRHHCDQFLQAECLRPSD